MKTFGMVTAGVATMGVSAHADSAPAASGATAPLMGKPTGNRVVVIGAGFGGLSFAKAVKKHNKAAEVVVLDKREVFVSCPYSNLWLGGVENVNYETLVQQFADAAESGEYTIMTNVTVTGIDRATKTVQTLKGTIEYDYLAVSPGVEYDYKGQFPSWSDEKITQVMNTCPAALANHSEIPMLKKMLEGVKDGKVIITVPAGKYRCPPAPYERASMFANYIKNNNIPAKVVIVDANPDVAAKGPAFKQSWADLYKDIIVYHRGCTVTDLDPVAKTISFIEKIPERKDAIGQVVEAEKTTEYKDVAFSACNFIPKNKASDVVKMANVKLAGNGFVLMDGAGFRSKDDANVYFVGDVVGHGMPPSGQTAVWAGKRAGKQLAMRMKGEAVDEYSELPYKAANVCYSMVSSAPEEAIMVLHEFSADKSAPVNQIKAAGSVPKERDPIWRGPKTAKGTHEWYKGIMRDLFL